jgi:ceramide glucosyltransferase
MLQVFCTPHLVNKRRDCRRTVIARWYRADYRNGHGAGQAVLLANLAGGFCVVATCVQLASVSVAAWRCRYRAAPKPGAVPAVSLLRPICGAENFLAETLGSSFRLDYPDYDILFCAARQDDPAVPIVRRLIEANPRVTARLLIGDDGISANPKLGNLVKGWDAARHEWIIMADSNVMLPDDFVQRLLAAWRSDSGVVCSMPIGARPENFWAELECAFLNTLQARFQYVSEALGWGFAQGKAMLFRRDIVERAGGIRALAAETAEDAATTKLVRAAGLRVHLVDAPFEQPLGRRRAGEVWARQLRWARLRRVSFPLPPESLRCWQSGLPPRRCWRARSAGTSRRAPRWRRCYATCCCRRCGSRRGSAPIMSGAAITSRRIAETTDGRAQAISRMRFRPATRIGASAYDFTLPRQARAA